MCGFRLNVSLMMAVAALACACAAIVGCAPRSTTRESKPPRQTATSPNTMGQPVWPFWPQTVRLHPLTRLMDDPSSGDQIIECRVEFADADGQTSKAVGQLTVQLYPESFLAIGEGALETWNQDLRDLALNRRQYDEVTRTYLFRLETSVPIPPGAELRVFFLSDDGRRMTAEMRLRQ